MMIRMRMIRMMMIRRMMMMIIIIMIIMITYWKPTRTTVIHSHDDYDDENPHPAKLQWPFTGLPARSQLEVTKLLQTPRSWWWFLCTSKNPCFAILQFFLSNTGRPLWLRDRIAIWLFISWQSAQVFLDGQQDKCKGKSSLVQDCINNLLAALKDINHDIFIFFLVYRW